MDELPSNLDSSLTLEDLENSNIQHNDVQNESLDPLSATEPPIEVIDLTKQENEEPITLESVDITPDKSGGVMKQIMKEGEGDKYPGFGDRVFVHYTGYLLTREKPVMFASSRKEERLEFNIGRGVVIKGWDLGVATMKKGEVALFIIQPNYGYGDMGNPPTIPPYSTLLFEIELFEWKLDDISPKRDGNILKKVLDKGEDSEYPNESAKVKVKLVGYYEDKIFEDCEKDFILGEGVSANVVEGVELALFKFHLKEKSLLYIKSRYGFEKGCDEFNIPPDASIVYEVTLLSFEKAKDVWEMNTDEKFEKAKISKEKGVAFIKDKKWKAALRQFRAVLACLEKETGVDPETKEARDNVLLSAYLNVTLCLLKMENYLDTIKFCDKALAMDPENEKALFRRAQAKLYMNDCQEALEDFNKIRNLYPENMVAVQNIITCQQKIKEQSLKDKSVYNKMFEKFMKQDAQRMRNLKTETGVWEDDETEKEPEEQYMTETERLIAENNSLLRDANVIEISNH